MWGSYRSSFQQRCMCSSLPRSPDCRLRSPARQIRMGVCWDLNPFPQVLVFACTTDLVVSCDPYRHSLGSDTLARCGGVDALTRVPHGSR